MHWNGTDQRLEPAEHYRTLAVMPHAGSVDVSAHTARGCDLNSRSTFCQRARIIHLEFTERFRAAYLVIIEPGRRLLMVEKVITKP
jgi:hypothetical protein